MTPPLRTSSAWQALEANAAAVREMHLRDLFAADPGRAERFTGEAAGLFLDYSKNRVTDETMRLLVALAEQPMSCERRDAMFAGEHINVTENRAVLHVALADAARALADRRRRRRRGGGARGARPDGGVLPTRCARARGRGSTGRPIRNVVNIGIGGSDLGPVMAYRALRHYSRRDMTFRFVSNVDGTDFAEATRDLDPAQTLFIICSKTFTTLETMTNATHREAVAARRARRRRGGDRPPLRRRVDEPRGRRRVRDRHRERLRVLGLGRRALLDGLGDRALDDARRRPGGVLAAPRGLPLDGRALPDGAARREPARADGPARGLVHGLLRRPDRRRAPLRPVPGAVSRLSPAADDGVERQERADRLVAGRRRHGAGLLGRARHERPAQLLPADPSGHPADPLRPDLLRDSLNPLGRPPRPPRRERLRAGRGARVREDGRGGRGRGDCPSGSCRIGPSRATGRRTCSWRSG